MFQSNQFTGNPTKLAYQSNIALWGAFGPTSEYLEFTLVSQMPMNTRIQSGYAIDRKTCSTAVVQDGATGEIKCKAGDGDAWTTNRVVLVTGDGLKATKVVEKTFLAIAYRST